MNPSDRPFGLVGLAKAHQVDTTVSDKRQENRDQDPFQFLPEYSTAEQLGQIDFSPIITHAFLIAVSTGEVQITIAENFAETRKYGEQTLAGLQDLLHLLVINGIEKENTWFFGAMMHVAILKHFVLSQILPDQVENFSLRDSLSYLTANALLQLFTTLKTQDAKAMQAIFYNYEKILDQPRTS